MKVVSVIFQALFIVATVVIPEIPVLASTLQQDLQHIFSKKVQAEWSVKVQDADTGEEIFSLSPRRQLVPASNMKVVVGAAGLLSLSPDFRYETSLYLSGQQVGTVWDGHLIVLGSGDPTIGGRFTNGDTTLLFRQWADFLQQRNITSITGNVIGVDDIFDDTPHGLNWNPIDLSSGTRRK